MSSKREGCFSWYYFFLPDALFPTFDSFLYCSFLVQGSISPSYSVILGIVTGNKYDFSPLLFHLHIPYHVQFYKYYLEVLRSVAKMTISANEVP